MCIYLRLFLGMGIIWYFEILAFALTSYKLNANIFILTDTLNMCQVKRLKRLFAIILLNSDFTGRVGVHHLRVQEERDQGVARKVKLETGEVKLIKFCPCMSQHQ